VKNFSTSRIKMNLSGFTNFIHTQSEYQKTINLSFKDSWSDKLTKKVEISLSRVITYGVLILIFKEVVIYAIRHWH
jgi:hypothetical protein